MGNQGCTECGNGQADEPQPLPRGTPGEGPSSLHAAADSSYEASSSSRASPYEVSLGGGLGSQRCGGSGGQDTGHGVGMGDDFDDDLAAMPYRGRRRQPRVERTYFDAEITEAPDQSDGQTGIAQWIEHRFKSGAFYRGEWLDCMRDGQGKQVWPDGTEYVGEWRRGRANGHGCMTRQGGDVYIGSWVNGRAHGLGFHDFGKGSAVYRGEHRCDFKEGFGVEIWSDGFAYMGQFRAGEKHGAGEAKWPDGSSYVGSWRVGQLAGPGVLRMHDGRAYQGQWAQSSPNGLGVYQWPDGSMYEGGYRFDKKNGFGILTEPDKPPNRGIWQHGLQIAGEAPGAEMATE
mmetsp:Transcript_86106/g.263531  ORF Transcript_86106/g.263531 Transcript_86106/m.263531 type:complete len:344 (-) Transcript_86106:100-1131(-)